MSRRSVHCPSSGDTHHDKRTLTIQGLYVGTAGRIEEMEWESGFTNVVEDQLDTTCRCRSWNAICGRSCQSFSLSHGRRRKAVGIHSHILLPCLDAKRLIMSGMVHVWWWKREIRSGTAAVQKPVRTGKQKTKS